MAKCAQCGRNMPSFTLKKICGWCEQYEAAQRGEVSDVQPVMVAPWKRSEIDETPVTLAILAINFLVFIMMVVSGVDAQNPTSADLVKWGANFGPYTLDGQWWRLVSHMFVHIGFFHLALNMWFLYALGKPCERLLGSVSYALMYFITGIAGGLGSLIVHPNSVSAGASGALFGILGSMIAVFKFGDFSMPQSLVRANLRSMLWCAGLNLAFGFVGNSDNSAHMGGLISGALIGFLISKAAPATDAYVRRAAVMLLVAAMVGGGLFWVKRNGGIFPNPQARYTELIRQGRIVELSKAVEKDPENTTLRIRLAWLYKSQGNIEEARRHYEWLIDHRPAGDTARMSAEYGMEYIFAEQKKFAEAESYFNALVAKSPNDVAAHYCLGDLAADQAHHDVAVAEFQKVASLTPNDVAAYAGMGNSYFQLKKYDESIAAYKKAIAVSDPEEDDVEDLKSHLAEVEKARQEAGPTK